MGALTGWQHCPRCSSGLENDELHVECESCGFVYYAHSAPAVSAFVRDDAGSVLLARRAREPDKGLWDTPGGFLEEGEDPLEGLKRELLEETGLTIAPGAFVGAFPDTYAGTRAVLNLVWEARPVAGEATPADDVSELRWFPPDDLPPESELAFQWIVPSLRDWLNSA